MLKYSQKQQIQERHCQEKPPTIPRDSSRILDLESRPQLPQKKQVPPTPCLSEEPVCPHSQHFPLFILQGSELHVIRGHMLAPLTAKESVESLTITPILIYHNIYHVLSVRYLPISISPFLGTVLI